jgi:hypothetical protein
MVLSVKEKGELFLVTMVSVVMPRRVGISKET